MNVRFVKSALLILAAWTVSSTLLCGCGGKGTEPETVTQESAAEEAAMAVAESEVFIDVVSETEETTQNIKELIQGTMYAISDVRIRKDATTDSDVLGTLKAGDEVSYLEQLGDWVEVVFEDGKAYVSADYLTEDRDWEQHLKTKNGYGDGAQIRLNPDWKYADFVEIGTDSATMYVAKKNRKNVVIGLNAGHGTKGGSNVKTWCHYDKTPKVTGGTTAAGATQAIAVSGGMTFADGTPESSVTLKEAQILKDMLLENGYDVLMLRDGSDVQLDNVARTVLCNNLADCHIAIHWDGDGLDYDKGCFYMSVPDGIKYLDTVAGTWEKSEALGDCLIKGLENTGNKIHGSGNMDMDLTQTSYSTVPSIDIELGNQSSDHSEEKLRQLAKGLLEGIDLYFGE